MTFLIIISLVYLVGFALCFWMLKTDHKAEGNVLTKGDQAVAFISSMLSWLTILSLLVSSWVGKITRSKYWARPVKDAPAETTTAPPSANGVHKQLAR